MLFVLKENNNLQSGKSREIIVNQYFSRIKSSDIEGLLALFSDDAVIREPFSKARTLVGKSEIKSFLSSAIMANEGLQYHIDIDGKTSKPLDNLVALVLFRKGDAINSRFTFGFEDANNSNTNRKTKIKSLVIEFLD